MDTSATLTINDVHTNSMAKGAGSQDDQQPTEAPEVRGVWSDVIQLRNVPIHTHLLPNGKVLFWGRRQQPTDNSFASLNEWETHTFLLNLKTMTCLPTSNQPTDVSGNTINLFCSSHTFLPDGRLMVTGGHLFDSQGIDCATIYDPARDLWSPAAPMQGQTTTEPANSLWKNGRWYPTAITLADGSIFVCSGSLANAAPAPLPNAPSSRNNTTPEIWDNAPWKQLTPFIEATDLQVFLFPRFHLAPDGRVFMSGPGPDSFFFDTTGTGTWQQTASRAAGPREYAPSVIYDTGKIVFLGGGNDQGTGFPSKLVETIDLNTAPSVWKPATSMNFRRRQHNATLLPDGTVLVTGGTQGNAGLGGNGFNDLSAGMPVHTAELWDPVTDMWKLMADEAADRCYHSTAVLLPDGRVLSGGGGEYQPTNVLAPNDPADSHLNAQIFSPPYLFRGPRPVIEKAPDQIVYGETFEVATPDFANIVNTSLVRLSSVTHSFNTDQQINFMKPSVQDGTVALTAPSNANVCPPGYYLLFVLNQQGVPSEAKMVRVVGQQPAPARVSVQVVDQLKRNQDIIANATRPQVVVGLTPVCPYGLDTCIAGALGALKKLDGVETVRSIVDKQAAVAFLYLDHDGLPNLRLWPRQFADTAQKSYVWRGVEVTLEGPVEANEDSLLLTATSNRPSVRIMPLRSTDKVQLDQTNGVPNLLPVNEAEAYAELDKTLQTAGTTAEFSITGPLLETGAGFVIEVRKFHQI